VVIMTLQRLVLWFLGVSAVVFVGAAGATVYQVLSPRPAPVATAVTAGPATPTAPVATAAAEPQPVVPATAPAAPPPSAPRAAVALPGRASHPGKPAATRSAGSVAAAPHPIHRPASATAARQIPTYRPGGYPPAAAIHGYPGHYAYYAGYRPYAYYYRVY
jgi:hypothetical protein